MNGHALECRGTAQTGGNRGTVSRLLARVRRFDRNAEISPYMCVARHIGSLHMENSDVGNDGLYCRQLHASERTYYYYTKGLLILDDVSACSCTGGEKRHSEGGGF